jgi:hypothetical protein
MLKTTTRVRRLRAEFSPIALGMLDQRSREYRLLRRFREALVAHIGGTPSAVQTALIERAAQLQLRIALFDAKFVEKGGMSDHDSRTYLAWSNSLTRTLAQLGLHATPSPRSTIDDHIKRIEAERSTPRRPVGHALPPDGVERVCVMAPIP